MVNLEYNLSTVLTILNDIYYKTITVDGYSYAVIKGHYELILDKTQTLYNAVDSELQSHSLCDCKTEY